MTSYIGFSIGVPAGLSGLIEKSLGTWRAVANAKNFGSDATQGVMMLQFEAFRYSAWTQESGALMKAPASRDELSFAYDIDSSVAKATRASPSMSIYEILYKAITQIHVVLEEVEKLLVKYDRAFESANQVDARMIDNLSSSLATLGNQNKEAAQAVTEYHGLQSRLQSESSALRKMNYGLQTWDDADKDVLKALVLRFKYWNDGLYQLIPLPRRNLLESKLSANTVGATNSPKGLERVQKAANEGSYTSVARSAKLKKYTLDPDSGDSGLEKKYGHVQNIDKLGPSRRLITWYSASGNDTQFTSVKPQKVIVEWYFYEKSWTDEQRLLADERVEQLAYDFSIREKPRFLRVLDCIGYICHPKKADRALLYAVPSRSPTIGQVNRLVSLYQILSSDSNVGMTTARPSLSDRFRLASFLAISFFELQNVSWLHKYFNSDNVLFLADSEGKVNFSEPYVSGFDFSRRDKPGQKSLQMSKSPLDLYRHPDLRRLRPNSEQLPAYSRKYDIFSLGLVLFEIGMWRRLDAFLKPNITPEAFRARISTYLERDMAMLMGDTYQQAVMKCISGHYLNDGLPEQISQDRDQTQDNQQDATEVDTNDEAFAQQALSELNSFYSSVVSELQRCHCGAQADGS